MSHKSEKPIVPCLLNKILKDNVVQNAKPLNELVKRWSVWREPRCTTRCLFVVIFPLSLN
ncbi:hypothetical protein Hanom_Chr15g01399371 [Helianthus anomalus]